MKTLSAQNKRFREIQRMPRNRYYIHTCCGQPMKRVGKTKQGLTAYQCPCGRVV